MKLKFFLQICDTQKSIILSLCRSSGVVDTVNNVQSSQISSLDPYV